MKSQGSEEMSAIKVQIQQLPDVILANLMRLKEEGMFRVDEAAKQDVIIDINLPKF